MSFVRLCVAVVASWILLLGLGATVILLTGCVTYVKDVTVEMPSEGQERLARETVNRVRAVVGNEGDD